MVLIGDSILGKMCWYIPKCHGVHSEHFPQEHGDAVNEGVESPVFGKMRENYAPDWPTGQHRPPRWAQRCLKTKVVIIYRLETKVVIIYVSARNKDRHHTSTRKKSRHYISARNKGRHHTSARNKSCHYISARNKGRHYISAKHKGRHVRVQDRL